MTPPSSFAVPPCAHPGEFIEVIPTPGLRYSRFPGDPGPSVESKSKVCVRFPVAGVTTNLVSQTG